MKGDDAAPARRRLFRSAMAGAAALTLPGATTSAAPPTEPIAASTAATVSGASTPTPAATKGSAARSGKLSFAFIGDRPTAAARKRR